MTEPTLSCGVVDNLELACMRGFELAVTMNDGVRLDGKAKNLTINDHHQECLILETHDGDHSIILAKARKAEALTRNDYFSELDLNKTEHN